MNDLISRKALLEKFQFRLPVTSVVDLTTRDCVEIGRKIISEAPAVDAVPIEQIRVDIMRIYLERREVILNVSICGKDNEVRIPYDKDVVEVVRCKNCKDHDRCEVEDLLHRFLCIENPYCAAGERKDNDK